MIYPIDFRRRKWYDEVTGKLNEQTGENENENGNLQV
jgi:hypothetical protein